MIGLKPDKFHLKSSQSLFFSLIHFLTTLHACDKESLLSYLDSRQIDRNHD